MNPSSVSFICPTCNRELKRDEPRALISNVNGRLTYGHGEACPAERVAALNAEANASKVRKFEAMKP